MKVCIGVVIFATLLGVAAPNQNVAGATSDRMSFLKVQKHEQLKNTMKQDLRNDGAGDFHMVPDNEDLRLMNENYDYVDLSQVPITPINEDDERKKHERYKLRQLRTKTTSTFWTWYTTRRKSAKLDTNNTKSTLKLPTPFNPISDVAIKSGLLTEPPTSSSSEEKGITEKGHKRKKKLISKKFFANDELGSFTNNDTANVSDSQLVPIQGHPFARAFPTTGHPADVFYYRRLVSPEKTEAPIQWVHCEDMITPYLTGLKKELTVPVLLQATHRKVLRLRHLLSLDTTKYSKDDIYSLMYQISNMKIRLFQWDISAIRELFVTLTKGKKHSFRMLKSSIQELFKSWHMDISNTTNLLVQSRLFRPYCTNRKEFDPSTKSSKVSKYYPPTSPSTKCDNSSDEDDRNSREHTY